jgi:hypothetical protein
MRTVVSKQTIAGSQIARGAAIGNHALYRFDEVIRRGMRSNFGQPLPVIKWFGDEALDRFAKRFAIVFAMFQPLVCFDID